MKNILKFNEKMGVPDGIIEAGIEIKELFLTRLKETSKRGRLYDDNISLGTKEISLMSKDINLDLTIDFEDFDTDKPILTSLYIKNSADIIDPDRKRNDTSFNGFGIVIARNTYITYEDLLNMVSEIPLSSFTHELKHIVDFKHKPIHSTEKGAIYNSTSSRTGIRPFDRLLYYIYYTFYTESLVRSSEVFGDITENGVSKSDFIKYMNDNNTITTLKDIQKFNYIDFKREVSESPNFDDIYDSIISNFDQEENNNNIGVDKVDTVINALLTHFLSNTKDEMDRVYKMYIRGNNTSHYELMNDESTLDRIKLAEDKMAKYINKLHNYVNNHEKYFVKLEKMLKFESSKVLKKLYKLYDMTKDDKREDSKSIKDWELHNKINTKKSFVDRMKDGDKDLIEEMNSIKKFKKR